MGRDFLKQLKGILETLSRRDPLIMMIQTTDLGYLSNRTYRLWLDHSRLGCIHLQRLMRTPSMIIVDVGLKNAT